MVIFKKVADLQDYLSGKRKEGHIIHFAPTMGALHAGHISLLSKAKAEGGLTVCSIFVNPTQFNDKNDYEKYPTSVDADIILLADAGCDVLFLPTVSEVYPGGPENVKVYDFGYLETILEGAHRPGHFRGVGQVVGRLLEIVQPQYLYLGQKDYQQCMVIGDLVRQMGRGEPQLIISPTVREADGLAMSSRNRRLTESQRAVAGAIYQCLVSIQSKKDSSRFDVVRKECIELLESKGFVPEYVALAKADDLALLDDYNPDLKMVALIAARIGDIRLIDNLVL